MTTDIETSRRRVIAQALMTLAFENAICPRVRYDKDGRAFASFNGELSGNVYEWRVTPSESYGILRPVANAPITFTIEGKTEELKSISPLFDDLRQAIGASLDEMKVIFSELQSTVKNDAATRSHRRSRNVTVNDDFATLEGAVTEGHKYHPCYKSRMGFTTAEHSLYGPEFAQEISPIWVALLRSEAVVSACQDTDYDELVRAELSNETIAEFESTLAATVNSPADYVWLPVHPWQFERVVQPRFIDGHDNNHVVVLGQANTRYTAQQSIRTLQNSQDLKAHTVKLGLSIVNTSTIRTLKPHNISNGPKISDWLTSLAAEDDRFAKMRPMFLREIAGAAHQPDLRLDGGDGTLSALWRESPYAFMESGENAIPLTALVHEQPDGTPFIDPWVKQQGLVGYVERTLRIVIEPLLHLFACHGIGIEAHSQNLGLVHRDGRADRLIFRDFHDGLRFSPSHLGNPQLFPELTAPPADHVAANPNSYLATDNTEEVEDYFHAAVYQWSMFPFAWFLEDKYGFAEADFLRLAARITDEYLAENADMVRPEFDPFKPKVRLPPLALQRFISDEERAQWVVVDNPLAKFRVA